MRRSGDALLSNATAERLETRLFLSTTYYVSPAGADQNAGTSPAAAWRTVTPIDNRTFKPGDKILFQGGATFSGSVILDPNDAGSSSNPVVISSYGSGRAKLAAGTGDGVVVYDTGGVDVSNL